ncbi:MAG: hypothetical protein BRC50_06440 [Cyanobacteria bacterium SW_11_48_12]|nr:MAG: hypothetical protein BRC50_06440 [Cyanobacteria bacterium SW_11_48_12]
MSYRTTRRTGHGSYHPSLSHSAERHAVGDTRGLLRCRFPVGAASQHPPASRGRSHSVRLECRFWRMLPWEFPPWQTVYGYFPSWRDQGSWKRIHRYLRGWGAALAQASAVALGGHRRYAVGAARLPHPPGRRC